jgi:hypothetical protein
MARTAGDLGDITLAQSHGDFQAGNIFVTRPDKTVYLIDWEYTASRWIAYDYLIYTLGLRFDAGLKDRLLDFLESTPMGGIAGFPGLTNEAEAAWRRSALAMLLLEDLTVIVEEQVREPYVRPLGRMRSVTAVIRELLPRLAR